MKLFAEVCENLSKESSTLKKIEIICEALLKIKDDSELSLFCIYLTGVVYPSSVQKTINVGQAFIRDAVLKHLGLTKEDWVEAYRKFGEIGETVEDLLQTSTFNLQPSISQRQTESVGISEGTEDSRLKIEHSTLFPDSVKKGPRIPTGISLAEFQDCIEQLNQNSANLKKVSIIAELLERISPLEAKYAMKLLSGRMRIGVQEATVEAAIAKAFEIEAPKVKKLNFYLGNIGDVAVRSRSKDFKNVHFVLFHPIRAMLASAEVDIAEIFERMGSEVWVEYKYDGIRAHIHKEGERVEIFTRDLKRITNQFPEVVEAFKGYDFSFLIDGEIVPYRDDKIQAFADLQKRLGRKEKIDEAVRDNPTRFVAYDFLYLNGELLFDKPLKERRELLEEKFTVGARHLSSEASAKEEGAPQQSLFFSTKKIVTTPKEFTEFFIKSKSEGREGLMVKNPESKYESGKRGIHWLKYKQTLDPLDVVVLIAEYGEGKNAKYLSNYTFGVWDEKKENLLPVGRVYSGAKEEDLKHFTELFPTIATEKIERGFKVQPQVIFEVGFENIQKSERYISGFAVRFPRILRIRSEGDKDLTEINTISDVKTAWERLNKGTENGEAV
jgi:DNA ligase-1